MKRPARNVAWFLTIVGAFVVVCGAMAPALPLVAIGVLYVGAGLWNLKRTSVDGLVVDALVMIVAGIFTGLAWRWVDSGDTHMAKALFGGLMQITWGIKRLKLWWTARDAFDDPPAIARLESIVHALSKRNRRDEAVAEFTTGRIRQHRNRLGLYSEGVVGLLEGGAVRLEKRSDIWIEARGTGVRERTVRISVRMSDHEMKGSMDARHLERFERWKLGMAAARSIAA
jgi:hypothetical protein